MFDLFRIYDIIYIYEPPQNPGNTKYVLDGHWFMECKRLDLPKLAIPLFKVMALYFSSIHISDTQIGRWFLWIIYIYIHIAVSCKRYPPSLPYGKRWDLPKFVDVLSVNLGFSRLLIYIYVCVKINEWIGTCYTPILNHLYLKLSSHIPSYVFVVPLLDLWNG